MITHRIIRMCPACLRCGLSLASHWGDPDGLHCQCQNPRYLRVEPSSAALRGLDGALADALAERLDSVPPDSRSILEHAMVRVTETMVFQGVSFYTALDDRRRELLDETFGSLSEYRWKMATLDRDENLDSITEEFGLDGSPRGLLADIDTVLSTVEVFFCSDTTILPDDVQGACRNWRLVWE